MDLAQRLMNFCRPLVFVVAIAVYMANTDHNPLAMAVYTLSVGFFVASSAIVVGWIPAPAHWYRVLIWIETALAAALTAFSTLSYHGGPIAMIYSPILVSLVLVVKRRDLAKSVGIVLASWGLSSLPHWVLMTPLSAAFEAGSYASLFLFSISISMLIGGLREEKDRSEGLLRQVHESQTALERAHRQLQDSAARQQNMAVLEERQRLAREIHDSVAHVLTTLVVQTQAARRLLERSPVEATASIRRCEEMAREALQEVRRALRALHPSGLEQQSDVEALRRLGRDFGIATGIQVEVSGDAQAEGLPPDPQRLEQLYRIFQEALTNSHRHGQAKHVWATLSVEAGQLQMLIRNDGLPPTNREPGIGHRSMGERTRSLGGTTEFLFGDQGLTIRVAVPIKQGAEA